jgi:isopentenyl diphosphate isomerase/L-lactate dehydrogenase-like FMN-dependent dehydrogenase
MGDIAHRSLETNFLGRNYSVPFGIAPMGMCNLAWPHADKYLAQVAQQAGCLFACQQLGRAQSKICIVGAARVRGFSCMLLSLLTWH